MLFRSDEYTYAVSRPWDTENPDGMFKGMFADKDFYLGKGLGDRCDHAHVHYLNLKPFGCEKGDRVSYTLNAANFENPVLAVRYKTVTDGDAEFLMNGKKVVFKNSPELTIGFIPYESRFTLESIGAAGIEFDFFAVVEENQKNEISTEYVLHSFVPEIKTELCGKLVEHTSELQSH